MLENSKIYCVSGYLLCNIIHGVCVLMTTCADCLLKTKSKLLYTATLLKRSSTSSHRKRGSFINKWDGTTDEQTVCMAIISTRFSARNNISLERELYTLCAVQRTAVVSVTYRDYCFYLFYECNTL